MNARFSVRPYHGDELELDRGDCLVGCTKRINVLLVGRSQTGKSTIVETLINPQNGTTCNGFSDTRNPECHILFLTDTSAKASYQLNIMDTPGLKELRENEESRRDSELLKLASECAKKHITSLNVVCFVSKAGDTHRLDTAAFQEIKNFLGDAYSEISMLVLTHCDEFSDNALESFEEKIRTHPVTEPYYQYCKLGIARYGAINLLKVDAFEEDTRGVIMKSRLRKIEKMRYDFLQKIISCADKGLPIKQLQEICEESDEAQKKAKEEGIEKMKENIKKRNCCVIL